MFKKIAYIFNDSEISAGTRGAGLGPNAIRVVDRNTDDFLFARYPVYNLKTINHCLDKPIKFKHAKRIEGLKIIYENITELIKEKRKENDFLLIVAGDHGSAGGTIAGLKSANPNNRIGVLWIDAHADIHTPFTTPSGNMHGMPLATALNEDNLACKQNEPAQEVVELWNQLKNVGGVSPKINFNDLAYIGLRDLETPETDLLKRYSVTDISVEELRKKGVRSIIDEIDKKFAACDEVYVSFDVDSLDPDLTSRGTGTPVPNGINIDEAKSLLVHFAAQQKVKCIEFVEVNPCLDDKINRMAEIAYELIKEVVETVENGR